MSRLLVECMYVASAQCCRLQEVYNELTSGSMKRVGQKVLIDFYQSKISSSFSFVCM